MQFKEAMTPGHKNALKKMEAHKNALKKMEGAMKCPACGMTIPSYPGRYPSKCPECGADLQECKKKPMESAEKLIDRYLAEKQKVPPEFKKYTIKKGSNDPVKVK